MNLIQNKNRFYIIFTLSLASIIAFIYIIAIMSYSESLQKHVISDGIIDVSDYDFNNKNLLALRGDWEFYYKKFIDPASPNLYVSDGNIMVPGLWNSFIYEGKKIGPMGYGTYRLHIKGIQSGREYGIKIPDIACSYKMYINGELIASNGSVGKSAIEENPQWLPSIAVYYSKTDEIDMLVHVSNFTHVKGGMWEPIKIGSPAALFRNRDINITRSILIIGALIALGIYHINLFFGISTVKSTLWLGLLCFGAALREAVTREVVLLSIFPSIPFNVIAKSEYITLPLIPLLFGPLVLELFSGVVNKKIMHGVFYINSLFIVIILFTPLKIFGSLLLLLEAGFLIGELVITYFLIKAIKAGCDGAAISAIGIIVFILASISDLFFVNSLYNVYPVSHMATIGFCFFILCQIITITTNIALAFENSKKLALAEVSFLQAQIVPHFLFNTINTIVYYIKISPEKACYLLVELSNYLRSKYYISDYTRHHMISLEEEINIIQSYLVIENARYKDKMKIYFDIAPETCTVKLPPLILQPIVENAVKHGIRSNPEDGIIKICTYKKDNNVFISIEDNGEGMDCRLISRLLNKNIANSKSVGLANVQNRLINHYGKGLTIISSKETGTKILIQIPFNQMN